MRKFPKHVRSPHRSGFTLIELLIAVAIFVILASLAASGYRATYESDKVGEGASIIRGGLEGARSRAIRAADRRGLRLILDPQDNHMVTSIAYVAPGEVITGYLRLEYDSSRTAWRVFPDNRNISDSITADSLLWNDLNQSGLLLPGCQISIDLSGTPFNAMLTSRRSDGAQPMGAAWEVNANPSITLTNDATEQDEFDNTSTTSMGLPGAVASIQYSYQLTLVPTILEGASPILLPSGVCVDLDGSRLPNNWRAATASAGYGPVLGGELFPMDIFFNKSGAIDRSQLRDAFLILRVANQEDVRDARGKLTTFSTSGPVVIKNPSNPARLVTVATQTGMMRVSRVNGELPESDRTTSNTTYFDSSSGDPNPFEAAVLGKETKR